MGKWYWRRIYKDQRNRRRKRPWPAKSPTRQPRLQSDTFASCCSWTYGSGLVLLLAWGLAFRSWHAGHQANAAEAAAFEEARDGGVEYLLRGVGGFAVRLGVGGMVLAPCRQPASDVGRPVAGHVRGGDADEAGRSQIVYVVLDAGERDAKNDLAHVAQIRPGEGRAHAQILDVASPAGAQSLSESRAEARPIGNVQNRKPAHHGVEGRVRKRISQRIAAEMRDAPAEVATLR